MTGIDEDAVDCCIGRELFGGGITFKNDGYGLFVTFSCNCEGLYDEYKSIIIIIIKTIMIFYLK